MIKEINGYYLTIIVLNVGLFATWVWLFVLYRKLRNSWHRYGLFLNALSYMVLVYSNTEVWKAGTHDLPFAAIVLRYSVYIMQLTASICFLYNYYHSKVVREE